MATNPQRLQAHTDAILNRVSTVAEQNRLGKALAWKAGTLDAYNIGTTAQKYQLTIDAVRKMSIDPVMEYEEYLASISLDGAKAAARAAARDAFADTP